MNGLPALKLFQAPDIGNIMRNIAVIKGSQLRSRLAEVGEAREERQEWRAVQDLSMKKGAEKRAIKKATREESKAEREKELENLKTITGTAQFVLRSAQTKPQDAQKAHDIGIKTLTELKGDTSDIPEEWGPEAQQYWEQTAQLGRNVLAFHMKGALKEPVSKQVWDKTTGQYVQRSQTEINKDPDRYGKTEETVMKHAKAGATTIDLTVAKKEALTKFQVEKGTDWVPEIMKDFKASQEDWDVMEPEAQEKAFQDYVLGAVSGLYKDAKFRRNKKTGEIALWGDGKPLRTWLKKNF